MLLHSGKPDKADIQLIIIYQDESQWSVSEDAVKAIFKDLGLPRPLLIQMGWGATKSSPIQSELMIIASFDQNQDSAASVSTAEIVRNSPATIAPSARERCRCSAFFDSGVPTGQADPI